VSFVTFVEPTSNGSDNETLGILVNKSDDGTRGSALLINGNGGMSILHHIPLEGTQFQGGAFLRDGAPENATFSPSTDVENF
jgi:hypothetical protein